MKLAFEHVNIGPLLATTEEPSFIIKREVPRSKQQTGFSAGEPKPDGRWYIAQSPVPLKDSEAMGWSWNGTSNNVLVPLIPYLTSDRQSRHLVGLAAQIGALAMQNRPWESRQPSLLLIGLSDVFEADNGGFRFWMGFAVRVSDI